MIAASSGKKGAVLVRSIIPQYGIEQMRNNRKIAIKPSVTDKNLTDGPGKICQALQITTKSSGKLITEGKLTIHRGLEKKIKISKTPRIGISHGKEKFYRYLMKEI